MTINLSDLTIVRKDRARLEYKTRHAMNTALCLVVMERIRKAQIERRKQK